MKPSPSKESGEIEYLSDISPRDKPWDLHRLMSDEISHLYLSVGHDRYSERIDECSKVLKFCLEGDSPQEVRLRLKEARFCRVRHCAVCQWRRSSMWLARFIKSIPLIKEKYPKAKWIFLTLTVRNCEITELRHTLTKMNAAWKRLTERKVFPALGFVKSVEVTRGKDGTAHPHFHCLLMVKPSYFAGSTYLSQEKWTELWKSCLRIDYDPIVNVKSIKVKDSIKKDITTNDYQEALTMAALETFKYSVKGSDLVKDANWLDELTRQLHNTRAIAIGGCLREIISEREPEDLIGEDTEEGSEPKQDEVSLLFDWVSTGKRYQRRQ